MEKQQKIALQINQVASSRDKSPGFLGNSNLGQLGLKHHVDPIGHNITRITATDECCLTLGAHNLYNCTSALGAPEKGAPV